jgi:hypothetical protein
MAERIATGKRPREDDGASTAATPLPDSGVVDVLKYQHAALSQNLYQYKRRIAALEASTGELSSSNAALYAALAEADARVAMVRSPPPRAARRAPPSS